MRLSRRALGLLVLTLGVGYLSLGRTFAEVRFVRLDKGIEFAIFTARPRGQPSIDFTVVRIDPNRARLEVLDLRHIGEGARDPHGPQLSYTLRELNRHRHPSVMMNGGFTNSFLLPRPSGLVRIAGKETAKLNAASNVQTGVLCITPNGTTRIMSSKNSEVTGCPYALQAGPMVVENPGVNGIHANAETRRFVRSLVGIDANGLVFFIHTSTASLFDIAQALTGKLQEGLALRAVLNLDGDADSGLILHRKDASDLVLGNIDATVPNAIVARPR